MRRRVVRAAVLAGVLCAWLVPAGSAQDSLGPVTGTLRLESSSIAAGIGVSWGNGVLTVDGVDHPFSVSGLSVVDLGISRVTASGEVFGLKKLEDFDGTYQGVALGVAVGGGSEVVAMRNEKGVFIRMRAGQQGVRLSLATKGTTLRLE